MKLSQMTVDELRAIPRFDGDDVDVQSFVALPTDRRHEDSGFRSMDIVVEQPDGTLTRIEGHIDGLALDNPMRAEVLDKSGLLLFFTKSKEPFRLRNPKIFSDFPVGSKPSGPPDAPKLRAARIEWLSSDGKILQTTSYDDAHATYPFDVEGASAGQVRVVDDHGNVLAQQSISIRFGDLLSLT